MARNSPRCSNAICPYLAWQVEQLPRLQAVVCTGDQDGDGEVESDLAPLRQLLPQRRVVELAHGVAEIVSRRGGAVRGGRNRFGS
jgi:hypothetical protein